MRFAFSLVLLPMILIGWFNQFGLLRVFLSHSISINRYFFSYYVEFNLEHSPSHSNPFYVSLALKAYHAQPFFMNSIYMVLLFSIIYQKKKKKVPVFSTFRHLLNCEHVVEVRRLGSSIGQLEVWWWWLGIWSLITQKQIGHLFSWYNSILRNHWWERIDASNAFNAQVFINQSIHRIPAKMGREFSWTSNFDHNPSS